MNPWLLVDRIVERVRRYYSLRTFLARVGGEASPTNCRVLGRIHVNATCVSIGKNVTLYPGVYFWGDGEIVIGDNCDIGKDTIIFASKNGGVWIGRDVNIAAQCYIIDSNHGLNRRDLVRCQPLDSERVVIGDDVWIGAQCAVIKGARIHDGAVIGAGAVVNSDVPAYAIAAGVPARVLGSRS